MLSYVLERKEAFQENKDVNFVKSKNGYLPKGLTHAWFRSKNPGFSSSMFISKQGLEIMLSYGLETKEAFDDDKNMNFWKFKKMGIYQRG